MNALRIILPKYLSRLAAMHALCIWLAMDSAQVTCLISDLSILVDLLIDLQPVPVCLIVEYGIKQTVPA